MLKYVCTTFMAMAAVAVSAMPAAAQSQSWSEAFQGQGRLAVLNQFNDEAVLDRETGLVWQLAPREEGLANFYVASRRCIDARTGGRRGWRLPTIVELQSLTDPGEIDPTLTLGHPFLNIAIEGVYWSSTTTADNPENVWALSLGTGAVSRAERCASAGCGEPKQAPRVWCVRGGGGPDAQ